MNAREMLSHEQAIELLPWLVNGSMDPEEEKDVRQHAFNCVICRRELKELERLGSSIAGAARRMHIPAPDMRNVNARIDGLIDRQNLGRKLVFRLRGAVSSPWRLAFAVQTVLVIALSAVLLLPGSENPEFTTLTQPQDLPEGHHFRVVFNPDMSAPELSGLLDEWELTVVDGPSARGVYTLGTSPTMSDEDRARLLADLRQEPNVLFAQKVVLREDQ